jgi:hypothetical protein
MKSKETLQDFTKFVENGENLAYQHGLITGLFITIAGFCVLKSTLPTRQSLSLAIGMFLD